MLSIDGPCTDESCHSGNTGIDPFLWLFFIPSTSRPQGCIVPHRFIEVEILCPARLSFNHRTTFVCWNPTLFLCLRFESVETNPIVSSVGTKGVSTNTQYRGYEDVSRIGYSPWRFSESGNVFLRMFFDTAILNDTCGCCRIAVQQWSSQPLFCDSG